MSDDKVFSFFVKGGVIIEATERRLKPNPALVGDLLPTVLTDPRDIEDAVARVANTPVTGKKRMCEHTGLECPADGCSCECERCEAIRQDEYMAEHYPTAMLTIEPSGTPVGGKGDET